MCRSSRGSGAHRSAGGASWWKTWSFHGNRCDEIRKLSRFTSPCAQGERCYMGHRSPANSSDSTAQLRRNVGKAAVSTVPLFRDGVTQHPVNFVSCTKTFRQVRNSLVPSPPRQSLQPRITSITANQPSFMQDYHGVPAGTRVCLAPPSHGLLPRASPA